MRLPVPEEQGLQIVGLFRALEHLGKRPVLVGGLVPPLLLSAMDPDAFQDFEPRRTTDCDVAIDIAVDGSGDWEKVQESLAALGFSFRPEQNQFRWQHPSGLRIDPMPVPAGIERGDHAALALAARFVSRDTRAFYRGYELALARFVDVDLELGDSVHRLRIAGLGALLAMKLQAWTDRRHERRKDAHDICWLLRQMSTAVAAAELLETRRLRPDLIDEVLQRLEESFSDPDAPGQRDYASERGCFLEDVIERHCQEAARAVGDLLRRCR
jgi:hypothetical protein